jgi:hypothetical protein
VQIAPRLAWLGTVGVAHQLPLLRVGAAVASVASVPGFASGASPLQAQYQTSQGFEAKLSGGTTLTTTGFLSASRGLTDLTSECRTLREPGAALPSGYDCADTSVRGGAYGLEVFLRRSLSSRLGGWISYTLSRATRDAHVHVGSVDTVARIASESDRTHVLNGAVSFDAGRRWRLGARLTFYTGQPYSATSNGVPIAPYNSQRFPSFFRADVRVEKRWMLGARGWIAASLDIENATLSSDVTGLECRPGGPGARDACTVATSVVTIPILGIEASM